jgi:hypothetical protein
MKRLLSFALAASLTVLVGCHSHKSAHEWREQRNKAIADAGFVANAAKYECKDLGHGVRGKPGNGGRCDFTWEVSDSTMATQGHLEAGLLVPTHDTVRFKHSGHKKFKYSVRPNPNDLENPPENTPQEQGCDASPLPGQSAQSKDDYKLGAVHQKGSANECHYKLTFTFDDGTPPIDPHIVIGGH